MSKDIGIDLGTANILVHLKGHGVVLNEPSILAIDRKTQEVIAIGKDAYEMVGRTPASIEVVRPLKGGVIADFDLAEVLLVLFLEKINTRSWFSKPNILICCPSNISEIEQMSLVEAAERATGGNIFIEEEPKIAAVGAGVDLLSPRGSMVIDLGGGTTDIAVLSSADILHSESIKIAGDDLDATIIQYFKDNFQLLIGERSAEQIKIKLSSAIHLDEAELEYAVVKGRDLVTGLPRSINVNSNHIFEAIEHHLITIARLAKTVLEDIPPEIASDIIEQGIIITGGGAMIYHIDTFLTDYLNVSVLKADQPMTCVAIGTGLMLDLILSGKLERKHTSQAKTNRFTQFFKRLKRRLLG